MAASPQLQHTHTHTHASATHRETHRSAVPLMPRLPSDPLHAVQARFALRDRERQTSADGGRGGEPRPPGVLDSPLDQEYHVDPGGRKTGIRGGRCSLAPSCGGCDGGTHHGSRRSMWSRRSWRATDLQGSHGWWLRVQSGKQGEGGPTEGPCGPGRPGSPLSPLTALMP